uniref:Uncharacterized protein n=1 Tax=Micrurus surinamensis TaxID=129470 RepID=A0A2D4PDY9_MICSU
MKTLKYHQLLSEFKKKSINSPRLTNTCLVNVQNYDSTDQDLQLPQVAAVTAFPQSHDCIVYDGILSAASHDHMITICNLHWQLPSSKINGKTGKKSQIAIH